MTRYVFSSVTRISDLPDREFSVESLPRATWETGDYVVGHVEGGAGEDLTVELRNGRMIEADRSDLIVGALGKRHATLDATGDWEAVGPDGLFHALTEGGLFGKCLSRSPYVKPLMSLVYRGHVLRKSGKVRMQDCVASTAGRFFHHTHGPADRLLHVRRQDHDFEDHHPALEVAGPPRPGRQAQWGGPIP